MHAALVAEFSKRQSVGGTGQFPGLVGGRLSGNVMPEIVVVVQILVSAGYTVDPPDKHAANIVIHLPMLTTVVTGKYLRSPAKQTKLPVNLPEKKDSTVAAHITTGKVHLNLSPFETWKKSD